MRAAVAHRLPFGLTAPKHGVILHGSTGAEDSVSLIVQRRRAATAAAAAGLRPAGPLFALARLADRLRLRLLLQLLLIVVGVELRNLAPRSVSSSPGKRGEAAGRVVGFRLVAVGLAGSAGGRGGGDGGGGLRSAGRRVSTLRCDCSRTWKKPITYRLTRLRTPEAVGQRAIGARIRRDLRIIIESECEVLESVHDRTARDSPARVSRTAEPPIPPSSAAHSRAAQKR